MNRAPRAGDREYSGQFKPNNSDAPKRRSKYGAQFSPYGTMPSELPFRRFIPDIAFLPSPVLPTHASSFLRGSGLNLGSEMIMPVRKTFAKRGARSKREPKWEKGLKICLQRTMTIKPSLKALYENIPDPRSDSKSFRKVTLDTVANGNFHEDELVIAVIFGSRNDSMKELLEKMPNAMKAGSQEADSAKVGDQFRRNHSRKKENIPTFSLLKQECNLPPALPMNLSTKNLARPSKPFPAFRSSNRANNGFGSEKHTFGMPPRTHPMAIRLRNNFQYNPSPSFVEPRPFRCVESTPMNQHEDLKDENSTFYDCQKEKPLKMECYVFRPSVKYRRSDAFRVSKRKPRIKRKKSLLFCQHCKQNIVATPTYRQEQRYFVLQHRCHSRPRTQYIIGRPRRDCHSQLCKREGCIKFLSDPPKEGI